MSESTQVWLRVSEALEYFGLSRKCFHANRKRGKYEVREITWRGGPTYEVKLEGEALYQYVEKNMPEKLRAPQVDGEATVARIENESSELDKMRSFQRDHVLAWKRILLETDGHTVKQISEYCDRYRLANPGFKISLGTYYSKKSAYEKHGARGLCPGWGSNKGESSVDPLWREHFLSIWLREGGPSAEVCRLETLGFALRMDAKIDATQFPSVGAFLRAVNLPKPYIDFRRKGRRYYLRNHEFFIARDWSGIAAGDGWVSDHHQLDVMVTIEGGKTCRPWLTVWRDLRSGKILSAYLHVDAPSADHVMMSFAWAVKEFGLPKFIYLDNGKDYRCIDFSGNVKKHRLWDATNEDYARSVCGELGVTVVFAREYNAQAKPVERDFRVVIGMYCKFMAGYTGSNVVEKPEALRGEIKRGDLLTYAELEQYTATFVEKVFNARVSNGALLQGLSPDAAFAKYRGQVRMISAHALKCCCMRSKRMTVGRDGLVDRELGIELRYWSDAFYTLRGEHVFVKRDIREYQTAWVYRDSDNAYLCTAQLYTRASGFAQGDVERSELKAAIERKNRDIKLATEATKTAPRPSAAEILENLQAGIAATAPAVPDMAAQAPIVQITPMDHAVAQHEQDLQRGKFDPKSFEPEDTSCSSEDSESLDDDVVWCLSKAS